MLKLVEDVYCPAPWERQLEESAEEHRLFWLWCGEGAPELSGDVLTLAQTQHWSDRYRALRVRLDEPNTTQDALAQARSDARDIVVRELRKLRDETRRNRHSRVLQPRELKTIRELETLLDEQLINTQTSTIQWDSVSDSDLEAAAEILQRLERSA